MGRRFDTPQPYRRKVGASRFSRAGFWVGATEQAVAPDGAIACLSKNISLGFVPSVRVVFQQVARVLRPGGVYHFMCANPFFMGMQEKDWNGEGYTIKHPYVNGAEITYEDQEWVYDRSKSGAAIPAPREFRHTLSALISGLVEQGFIIQHISDYSSFNPDPNAEPGTWSHFVSIAPPWLSFWASYRPDVLSLEPLQCQGSPALMFHEGA